MRDAYLAESDVLFRSTFENAAVGIAHVSPDGLWLRANQTLCRIMGYAEKDIVGRHKFEFLHGDEIPAVRRDMEKLLSGQISSYSGRRRSIRKNGSVVWTKATVSLAHKADDSPDYLIIFVEDISREKEVETALEESNQLLECVIEELPAMIFLKRAEDLRFIRLNRAAEQLLGHPRAFIVGKTDYHIFPKEQADFFTAIDREVLAGEEPREIEEEPIQTPQGMRYLNTRKIALRNARGEPNCLLGVSLDITERKKAEALSRSILQALPAQIVVIEGEGRIVAMNEAWAKFAVAEKSTFMSTLSVGTNYFDVCRKSAPDEADAARAIAGIQAVMAGDCPQFSMEYACPEVAAWFLMTAVPLPGRQEQSAVVAHTDITERKSAEQILSNANRELERRVLERTHRLEEEIRHREDAQQRLSWALQGSGGGAWDWDVQRDELWWSEEMYELWGIPACTKLQSSDVVDLIHEQDRERVRREYENCISERTSYRSEFRVHHKTRGERWLLSLGRLVLDKNNITVRMLGLSIDVTERKLNEEALALARRLEAVGQLAGGVAHDSNNLLAVIAGSLELAEQRVHDEPTRQLLRRALDAAEMGGSFNRRLLSLARRHELAPQQLVLNGRVEETLKLLERTLGEHIEIATDLERDLWLTLADPGEIDSALLNLTVNARDAMPYGGKIIIATANVSLDAAEARKHPDAHPGDYVSLSVRDTGAGMSAETLRRAMEPFFTTKGPGKGTGLGLSSVASFAKQSGGFITIASDLDKGTAVRLYMRRAIEEPERQTGSTQDGPPPGEGELVLVVEDDDQVRELTLKRLESLGYAVTEARTGFEAIERLKSGEPIQLVLSDIVMPGGMTGYDVARWAASNRPEVKVILSSGYNVGDGARYGQRALDNVTVLGKPIARYQLAHALRKALVA